MLDSRARLLNATKTSQDAPMQLITAKYIYSHRSFSTNNNLRRVVFRNRKLLEVLMIRNNQPLLISKMQETDETIRR